MLDFETFREAAARCGCGEQSDAVAKELAKLSQIDFDLKCVVHKARVLAEGHAKAMADLAREREAIQARCPHYAGQVRTGHEGDDSWTECKTCGKSL